MSSGTGRRPRRRSSTGDNGRARCRFATVKDNPGQARPRRWRLPPPPPPPPRRAASRPRWRPPSGGAKCAVRRGGGRRGLALDGPAGGGRGGDASPRAKWQARAGRGRGRHAGGGRPAAVEVTLPSAASGRPSQMRSRPPRRRPVGRRVEVTLPSAANGRPLRSRSPLPRQTPAGPRWSRPRWLWSAEAAMSSRAPQPGQGGARTRRAPRRFRPPPPGRARPTRTGWREGGGGAAEAGATVPPGPAATRRAAALGPRPAGGCLPGTVVVADAAPRRQARRRPLPRRQAHTPPASRPRTRRR
jgi:hypothetical protein